MNTAETTASEAHRASGIALMLASSASNQAGAALGANAFPMIGPVGVVAVRQLVTALVLGTAVRPRLRTLRRAQWLPVLGLAAVLSLMNVCLYAAIDRIGLGLAVTLEFLGPLGVAIAASRRSVDIACAVAAGVGVVVLTDPGPTTDLLGVTLSLVAAGGWAAYILLNRTLGQRLPGIEGTAVASLVSAAVWTPIGLAWFLTHRSTGAAIALAAACGLMSSIIPYAVDLLALRRTPARVFGIFTSVNPVWAALAGWLVLGQALHPNEAIGVAIIVGSNVVVSVRSLVGRADDGSGPRADQVSLAAATMRSR